MNDISDLGLDLENLFQPAWTKGKAETNRFEKFTGNEGVKPERHGARREFGGERRGDRPRSGGKPGGKKDFRRGEKRGERFNASASQRFHEEKPLPEIAVTFLPDEKGVEQLARQIKMTGRAYPLFQIAQLVLQKPERYSVQLAVKKKSDGAIAQSLFVCALDDSPWLSEDEAVAHVLKNHFATFYQAERTPTDPPKGTYTFVAQCGMSGVILGPPNYHDYQNQLRKLHAERFSKMPFDVFKARVKIVRDEAVVKEWIEEQSFKTEYNALNIAEPLKIPSPEEVEKHFRATHKDSMIKSVETLVVDGVKSRNLRNRELYRLVRAEWEHQKHFPLQLAMRLSKHFASHGLQFFKVNKTAVHVSVARPQFLDLETTPVSENVKRIIGFINTTPKCTRRKLIETLAPTPKVEKVEVAPKVESAVKSVAESSVPAPVAESEMPASVPETKPVEPKSIEPTPEQTALIADLHWLIHQGHVLEFADGRMETAKKPAPKPPKPEAKPTEEAKPVGEKPVAEMEPVSAAETSAESATDTPEISATVEVSASESVQPEKFEATAEAGTAEEIPAPGRSEN